MQLKEISKDIYDVSALLDEVLGKEGTPEREKSCEKAWEDCISFCVDADSVSCPIHDIQLLQ